MFKTLYLRILGWLPKQNTIVFQSHPDFSDNAKALYDYLKDTMGDKYQYVWVASEKEALWKHKYPEITIVELQPETVLERFRKTFHIFTSRYIFYSHLAPITHKYYGGTMVNLWHGSGLKKPNNKSMTAEYDFMHCSSDFFKNLRVRNYGCTPAKQLLLGNPRCDNLFHKENIDSLIEASLSDFDKVIMYMPTFRSTKNGVDEYDNTTRNLKDQIFFDETCHKALNETLTKNNTLLLIKPHPMDNIPDKLTNASHIRFITNDMLQLYEYCLYSILAHADALITDVSSVLTDYLLLDRPVGFVIDDYEQYTSGYHVENVLDYMPGEKIHDLSELISFLEANVDAPQVSDTYREDRQKLNDLFNHHKSDFCKRIADHYHL